MKLAFNLYAVFLAGCAMDMASAQFQNECGLKDPNKATDSECPSSKPFCCSLTEKT